MSDKSLPQGLHPDTLAVRAAVDRSHYGEHSEALYLTSSFVQPDAETAARRFAMEEEGYTYTRSGNPTVTSLELRLAAMEDQRQLLQFATLGGSTAAAALATVSPPMPLSKIPIGLLL